MLNIEPRLRIRGHGRRLRVRERGDWCVDHSASLRESCRASVAIDKTVAQAIGRARAAGMSWQTIGRTIGATEDAESKHQLIDALAANRRAVLQHLLDDAS
jgi:hypothetical protein